jgi:hypothetical protein
MGCGELCTTALRSACGKQGRTRAVILLSVAIVLGGCAREPSSAAHTVADYRANGGLRKEAFARCANDPGTLGQTPDCVNVREAQRLEDLGSIRNTPPIKLPPPGAQ